MIYYLTLQFVVDQQFFNYIISL